jgi:hypothetical protein
MRRRSRASRPQYRTKSQNGAPRPMKILLEGEVSIDRNEHVELLLGKCQ